MTPLTVTENIKAKSRIFEKIRHLKQNPLLKCIEDFDEKTLKYGQCGALGLATYLRIGINLEILTGVQNKGLPSIFSNDILYKNFERFFGNI